MPVEVAASGPKVIAMSALHAERVMFTLGADVERLQWGIELARKTRRDAGLDPDAIAFGAYINMGCHSDVEKARGLVRGGLTTFARFSVMHGKANGPVSAKDRALLETLLTNYDMKQHTRADSRQAGTLTDDFVDRFAVVGPPDRCIERLKSLASARPRQGRDQRRHARRVGGGCGRQDATWWRSTCCRACPVMRTRVTCVASRPAVMQVDARRACRTRRI